MSGTTSDFQLADAVLRSRFLLGTAGYPSPRVLREAIQASGAEVVTLGLKRQLSSSAGDNGFIEIIKGCGARLLPNTAGCRTAREAVTLAQMARELLETHWIKLEVVGDEHTLQPDPFELIDAAEQLVKEGFEVFPYCTDDLVSCQRLLDVGCRILMPWGAPIGSGQGLINPWALRTLRSRLPDYDYERHVGGAVYIFLRGHAAAGQGLHLERPPLALMNALDDLFRGIRRPVKPLPKGQMELDL